MGKWEILWGADEIFLGKDFCKQMVFFFSISVIEKGFKYI